MGWVEYRLGHVSQGLQYLGALSSNVLIRRSPLTWAK
jgi:hypothetical protein